MRSSFETEGEGKVWITINCECSNAFWDKQQKYLQSLRILKLPDQPVAVMTICCGLSVGWFVGE